MAKLRRRSKSCHHTGAKRILEGPTRGNRNHVKADEKEKDQANEETVFTAPRRHIARRHLSGRRSRARGACVLAEGRLTHNGQMGNRDASISTLNLAATASNATGTTNIARRRNLTENTATSRIVA